MQPTDLEEALLEGHELGVHEPALIQPQRQQLQQRARAGSGPRPRRRAGCNSSVTAQRWESLQNSHTIQWRMPRSASSCSSAPGLATGPAPGDALAAGCARRCAALAGCVPVRLLQDDTRRLGIVGQLPVRRYQPWAAVICRLHHGFGSLTVGCPKSNFQGHFQKTLCSSDALAGVDSDSVATAAATASAPATPSGCTCVHSSASRTARWNTSGSACLRPAAGRLCRRNAGHASFDALLTMHC